MGCEKQGIVKDRRYLGHGMEHYHPESPARLQAVYSMLEKPDGPGSFRRMNPATPTGRKSRSSMNRTISNCG